MSFELMLSSNSTIETDLSTLLLDGAAFLKLSEIDSPRLEAELLLADVLSCRRMDLYSSPDQSLSAQEQRRFWSHLERRCLHEPLQYITESVEFCGLNLHVQSGVFIPRPETELIVEAAEQILTAPRRILDLCTGSAALAIALSKSFPESQIIACDCSTEALKVAGINLERHACSSQISLVKGNFLDPFLTLSREEQGFDLIVCNPPYIAEADRDSLPTNVRDYEPDIALFAPDEGRAFYRRILNEAPAILRQSGTMLLELGMGKADWLQAQVEKEGKLNITFISDWASIKRVARITRIRQACDG